MALFSKPLSKKQVPSSADANARSGKRGAVPGAGGDAEPRKRLPESSIGGITITGFGVVDWSPTRRQIEVTQGQAGMCAVLENAVLLYASGHADQALPLLARGVQEDEDKRSPLAWLALFDLLQRAGNRAAFEQLALLYVVRFERSAPSWDERARPPAVHSSDRRWLHCRHRQADRGERHHFESLKRAIVRNDSQARFDLAAVTEFDDGGARALAEVLARPAAANIRCACSAERLQRALGAPSAGVARRRGRVAAVARAAAMAKRSRELRRLGRPVRDHLRGVSTVVGTTVDAPSGCGATSAPASAAEAESLAGGGEMLAMSGVGGSHAPRLRSSPSSRNNAISWQST
jgi:hypothetical protein